MGIPMAEYATKQDVQEIVGKAVQDLSKTVDEKIDRAVDNLSKTVDDKIGKAVDDLSEIIANLAQSMHAEILDLKRADLELKRSIDRLTNTIDGFLARIDNYETEMAARDSQFEKLLAWARKVSEKTGIPLENL